MSRTARRCLARGAAPPLPQTSRARRTAGALWANPHGIAQPWRRRGLQLALDGKDVELLRDSALLALGALVLTQTASAAVFGRVAVANAM